MPRPPGKARDLDFSKVGTAGRRTGLTLKEGQRDEYGMEEVDGIFSSPEKSPAKMNGFDNADNEDSIGSEGMSMDEENAPGPMDFLNGANRSHSVAMPAPGLSASIRRSPVLRSSPEQDDLLSPSPSDGKSLNGARQEPSPLTTRSVNAGTSNQKNNSRRPAKAPLAAPAQHAVHDFSDGEGDENAETFTPVENGFDDSFDAGNETVVHDDSLPQTADQQPSGTDSDLSLVQGSSTRTEKVSSTSKTMKKGIAPQASAKTNGNAKSTRRGRPPKSQHPAEEAADTRPAKKLKTSSNQSQTTREALDPELNRVVENYAQRSGPLKGRSLYILKKEDPSDTSSTHTRSGRVSIRPLAYWRNERCVYGDGEAAEGQRYPLSTIKEIVRTEEHVPEQKKKGKRSGRKSKSKKHRDESSDEEDEDVDLWEKEGVLHGYVPKWDPKTQTASEEELLDIAYGPSGIVTREVKDSTFRFAKLLSSSFIGSGVVELPPDGVKKPKNSKKMHMVFYVCHGRVQVGISDVQFTAGKGSVFQVPRGNYYSFANPYGKEARLFFTQGCVPGEGEELPPSESKNAVQESEFEPDSGTSAPRAAKSRGRPKGKQRAGK
ncbi:uncharacterized protein N7459_003915 [Penicillium hispanicum]|uniref:uncharacterized protein n=1 Tax=Penicillium hispanicum TaxID=1080232 RepID=UPI0025413DC1|nr:uncharacterized protein N7459_003915 [Penicillium hispanicum]KAJ5584115.1 hypothetical protein N7459_003915 [Penicillium hispanicum]